MLEINNEGRALTKIERIRGVKFPMNCPYSNCGSTHTFVNHAECSHDENIHTVGVRCEECNGKWVETYKLRGISDAQ